MKSNWELEYAKLIVRILNEGRRKECRNGYTISIFGQVLKIDMADQGFPILQGRKMFTKGVFGELSAMLAGAQSVEEFKAHGCNYWDMWADDTGHLELDYGRAWRDFNGVDQMADLIHKLKHNPNDRRMIISGWRPDRLKSLSLPCCHMLYQWYVTTDGKLNMIWYQRSVDTMIGLPSDIIFAAAWNMLLANECGYTPGELTFMLGDTHIYAEHIEQTKLYLTRLANMNRIQHGGDSRLYIPVRYTLDNDATVDNFNKDMIQLTNYEPLEAIKFELKG